MASRDPLIRHAITPPAFDPRTDLHRERLVDVIHANIPRKLVAIGAPAGYGKTTLLADFQHHTDLTVCWVRLTEADWDVMRFANVLAASLQLRFRRLKGEPDLGTLSGSSPEALAVAFAAAIDEQIGETFVIALDDVHHINQSKPVLALLDRLLLELPEQATVIAAGREVLETSVLARLMAERSLAGLGPHDLALTRDELVELTKLQQAQELADPDIDRLLEESRGWVTGIVMSGRVANLSSGTLIGGGRPMVYEYLASVVLNRQPDDLRRFALDASVIPVMTAATCDEVLDRQDSRKYLGRLERAGLFVTATSGSPKSYEFHPLFRDFLLQSLESANPKRLASIRRKAADHYVAQDAPELAVDLLIDAGSIARAASLAEASSYALFTQGRLQTLEAWAERLRPHKAKVPNILIRLASSASDRGQIDQADALLEEAKGQISPKSSKDLRVRFELAVGFVRYRQGRTADVGRAIKHVEDIYRKRANTRLLSIARRLEALNLMGQGANYERAEALLREAASGLEAAQDPYNLLATLIDLAYAQYALGSGPEERRTRSRVLSLARSIGAPLTLAVAHGNSALSAHEAGDYHLALELARDGLKFARQAASPLREGINLIRQADTFNDLGLVLQAAELYEEAIRLFTDLDVSNWIQYACIQTSVLHRRNGGIEPAREWIKHALLFEQGQQPSSELRIQLAALEIHASPEKATKVLRSVLQDGGPLGDSRERTQAQFFLGRASLAVGDLDQARQQLQLAVGLAGAHQTEQYIAGELLSDAGALEFMRQQLGGAPAMTVIVNRLQSMRAFASQFRSPSQAAAAGRPQLRMRALGASQVIAGGADITKLKPRSREVLFYLLDRGRSTTDHLAEAFWPELPAGRKKASLHTAISEIRGELGKEMVSLDGSTYSLQPESPIEYDVHRFERAASAVDGLPPGDPRLMFALTEAKNSYAGSFLPGYDSEWVENRRHELELRFLDVLTSYAYEAIVNDQPLQAISALREALRIDPYRDDTNYNYLEALGRLGRRAELVSHYQSYVQLLSNDLGLDPPDPTRELYDRLIS